jgi:LysR family glycine cleavage system transcriptional activator
MRNLPPLKSIKFFESSFRLGSFSLAANELFVTPGAVGQHIRKLELWLGVTLFTRQVRQIQPTLDGVAYYARIQPALTQLIQASHSLRQQKNDAVWISMPPSLAAKWFSHRMADFLTSYPDITLHISSSTNVVDFERDQVDLAIRYFDGQTDGLESTQLFPGKVGAYSSPEYGKHLTHLDQLLDATLIRNSSHAYWDEWLNKFTPFTPEQIQSIKSLHMNETSLAIETARQCQGIILTMPELIEQEMAAGTLIQLFEHHISPESGYYIVHQNMTALRPPVQILKNWLIAHSKPINYQSKPPQ